VSQKIKVKQIRSTIAVPEKLRLVVKGLGLRGVGSEKTHQDNNCIRGMINKVKHLIAYDIIK
jgi:large subunit ribosomal protein L30